MEHVAIDLGGKESQICIRDASGRIMLEKRLPTARLGYFLHQRPHSRVIMETCAESFAIAEHAVAAGHEVKVVPATLVRTLGVGARRTKTDRRDAQVLSEVSCRIELPSVHLRSSRARELISMYRSRDVQVSSRTMAVNNVRGWLRTLNLRLPTRGTKTFPARVRGFLEENGVEVPSYVARALKHIDTLNELIAEATEEMQAIASNDERCRILMTAPGVGPITAVRFLAALDDVNRFADAHAVSSYLGLTPGENSSSERRQRLSITKAGPADMRKLLVQASWTAWRSCKNDPLTLWGLQVAARRGPRIAVVAMARKLAGILYAMWRDMRPYDPKLAAQAIIQEPAA